MAEENNELLQLTADIVSAHVSNNTVAVGDLPGLLRQVHGALSGLGSPQEEQGPGKREPVVSPRSSVKPESITCLVCGQKAKMLKRHLANAHDLTPQQYREEVGLKPDYPMVAPNYADQRRDLAKKIGLGRRPRDRGKPDAKGGDGGAQKAAGADTRKGGGRRRKADTPSG